MSDPVKAPAHYAGDGKIECMDAMRSMLAGYAGGGADLEATYWATCALKYLWRWPLKNGRQDLEKAQRCIEYACAAVSEDARPDSYDELASDLFDVFSDCGYGKDGAQAMAGEVIARAKKIGGIS